MPFGLDVKSLLVGIAFALWIFPWIMGMFSRGKSAPAKTA